MFLLHGKSVVRASLHSLSKRFGYNPTVPPCPPPPARPPPSMHDPNKHLQKRNSGLGDPDEVLDIGRVIHRKRQRPTAPFHYGAGRENRPQKARDSSAPGPGDYTVPSGLDVKRDPGRRDLSFLSTSRRFDEPETGARSRAPGPGSYVTAPSDFDRARALPRARPRRCSHTAPVGFQSTTLRFAGNDLKREQGGLGSASCSSVSGMADEIARKGSAGSGKKVGAFGSTARRFPVRGAGQPNLPGPGSYELGVGAGSSDGVELGEKRRHRRPADSAGPAGKLLPSALSCFSSGGW